MKTEKEIIELISMLKESIETRERLIIDPSVDSVGRADYRNEIEELKNDIKMLEWVLE